MNRAKPLILIVLLYLCIESMGAYARTHVVTVEGEVRDKEGMPIAGASVSVYPIWLPRKADVTTGIDGSFRIQGSMPKEGYSLRVEADGYITYEKELIFEQSKILVVVKLERSHENDRNPGR